MVDSNADCTLHLDQPSGKAAGPIPGHADNTVDRTETPWAVIARIHSNVATYLGPKLRGGEGADMFEGTKR